MRRVRLLKAWQDWQPSQVFDEMPQSSAELLVGRGFAEYIDEQVPRAPVDRMLRARKAERRAS